MEIANDGVQNCLFMRVYVWVCVHVCMCVRVLPVPVGAYGTDAVAMFTLTANSTCAHYAGAIKGMCVRQYLPHWKQSTAFGNTPQAGYIPLSQVRECVPIASASHDPHRSRHCLPVFVVC